MLVELHVVDLGIVADLDLVLGPGLTAITGETGAGKTLLVEAVELLVGGRADAGLVRDGAREARVEGRFVDSETGHETVLARVVPRDGRSRAYLDGRLATVGELAEAGRALVDLHGQHAHQSLLDPAIQRGALDRYAGPPALDAQARYRDARAAVRDLDAELAGLGGDARARAREIDLLRYQVEEITAAALDDAAEDVALEAEEALLADAVAHREALARAYEALEGPGLDAVGTALAALDGRAPFAELADRLRGAQGELADLEQELRREVERVDDDPARVDAVRARRHQLHELGRKYGSTLADVIAYGVEAAARLDELERYEERAAELEHRRGARERDAASAAAELSAARRAAAGPLGTAVSGHLRELAMPHATVEIDVEVGPPTDDGHDQVTYLLAANPGERARPLARAASGGELSRAMLAARVVLSEAPPTLVFDEVDAGIGGEAGAAVGRLLQALGSRHQVLCVTHLAQVAAFAGTQVVVEKAVEREQSVDGRRRDRTVAHA
ncbi:MAG TPA: DNA repair protein RecN, partial [Acidimicrobiia bacterium]|nr:DNA repair protein RecN [Acidimicrobiia bacterium]